MLNSNYLLALVEKAHVMMLMNNWDEAIATVHRVLRKDPGTHILFSPAAGLPH
jgi:hypothetical protein